MTGTLARQPALAATRAATGMVYSLDSSPKLAADLRACQASIPREVVPRALVDDSFLGDGGVLVHMHYFESDSLIECERRNKRMNLAMLIDQAMATHQPNVTFLVTSSGDALPSVAEFYTDIGAPVPARPNLFPANMQFQPVGNTATDLCPRVGVMEANPQAAYYLFLNDGARGPYRDATSATLATQLGVPLWLARFAQAFAVDDAVGAVGATLSCEIDLHVQSWAVMVDARVSPIFLQAYNETCASEMTKPEAIRVGEVDVHREMLKNGFRLSSLWSEVNGITDADRDCFFAKSQIPQECDNPYNGWSDWTDTDFEAQTFIKHGGEPWRQGALPADYLDHAYNDTVAGLGLNATANPNATYAGRFCCCDADDEWCDYRWALTGMPTYYVVLLAVGGTLLLVFLGWLLCWCVSRPPGKAGTEQQPLKQPLQK